MVDVAVQTVPAIHRLTVRPAGDDPRCTVLLQDAIDLGITTLHSVQIQDLVFVRGDVNEHDRRQLQDILVDPLLQEASWNTFHSTTQHVVESALHSGVTDSVAHELHRVAARLGVTIEAVATGKRFELNGALTHTDLDILVGKLLVNPVIENCAIDTAIIPAFADSGTSATSGVSYVSIPSDATDDDLQKLNLQRGLAMDIEELRAVRDHYVSAGAVARDIELESIAQTWSEHCAHKTFRASITLDDGTIIPSLINQLRDTTENIDAPYVVSSFVGNAGIISFVPGTTIALKCETHNHPSAIEPFGGANTGVGGVIRDVLGASHLPIACTNILCFGTPTTQASDLPEGVFHPRRIRAGVIAGIADYGNKIGLPTVAGAVLYDDGYIANPLVYAGCIGVAYRPYHAQAPEPGDRIIVLGGRTGRDGLRGATFSSMTMDATTGDVSGASVQIGDPITEKLLIDVLGRGQDLFRSITDCGAGGLSSAIGEMAQDIGACVELSELPLKYPGLAPWEIWLSEAQERMVVAVQDAGALKEACERFGVEFTDVGFFTGDGRLVVHHGGNVVVDLDLEFLHNGRPQRHMHAVMPSPVRESMTPTQFSTKFGNIDVVDSLKRLLSHPNIASKAAVIHRYDHEIRGATLVRPLIGACADGHADGVVIAEPLDTHGIAIGIGVNPWFGVLDAERMALSVVDEAMRNVVAVGADPDSVALLDNFSWGDPRRSSTLGDLVAAVQGCCDAALAFRAPFVSGKDSLNNEYLGSDGERHSVPPTLVITAIAHVPDAESTVTPDLKASGNLVVLLGNTSLEFGASHLAIVHGVTDAGAVPAFDASAPRRYRLLHRAIRDGLVRACHDIAEGGIAVALAEMAIAGRMGVEMSSKLSVAQLFSESNGRFLLEVSPAHVDTIIERFGDEAIVIGLVTSEQEMRLPNKQIVSIQELCSAWQEIS